MKKQHGHVNRLRHDEVTSRDIPNLSDRRSYARSRSSNIVARFVDFNKETGEVHYSVTSQAKAGKSYTVTFRFKDWNPDMAHLDDEIQHAVKGNIEIDCTCPAFTYQGYKFLASIKGGSVDIERRPPDETNPDRHGYACKHILKAIDSFNQDFDKFRAEGKGMIKKHNLRVQHKYERRQTLESSSSYSLSEKLDMRFMTYCDEVLGIHLSSIQSSSLRSSMAKALHDYMEQLMELCDLGNTYDALERVFATGNPKGFDEKNQDKYDRLVNTLKRHFSNLSGGVFEVHEARGGRVGHFPTDIRIEFGLDDGGTTLWTSSLRIPLTLCFPPFGQFRLLPEKLIADKINDWIVDEVQNLSDDWDRARRNIYSDIVEESNMKTRRKNRKFEGVRNEDRLQALVEFCPLLDTSNVSVNTVSGYDGPVTEISVAGSEFWVLTEEEAAREATASFIETFSGRDIESDSALNMTAELTSVLDYDAIREVYGEPDFDDDDEDDRDEYVPDDDDLHDWARDNFSNAELWDNGMIDKEKFCEALWDVYGYGQELDMEQRNESVEVNGVVFYIFLRDGEWLALESRSFRNKSSRMKKRLERKTFR